MGFDCCFIKINDQINLEFIGLDRGILYINQLGNPIKMAIQNDDIAKIRDFLNYCYPKGQ